MVSACLLQRRLSMTLLGFRVGLLLYIPFPSACLCQDMSRVCREVILSQGVAGGPGGHGACLFGDIRDHIANSASVFGSFEQVMSQLGLLPLTPGAWCYRHGRMCGIRDAEVNVSGPPCTDFSPQGLRRGIQGPTMVAFLCWARLVCASTQLRLVVFENVPEFPQWLLEFAFGHAFWLHRIAVSPSDCGLGLVRRDRVYVLMIPKQRAILTHCPHEMHDLMVASMAHVQTVPGHALLAGPAEVWDEVAELSTRRSRQLRGSRGSRGPRAEGFQQIRPSDVLTPRERDAINTYDYLYWRRVGNNPESNLSLFYFLGDNPQARCSWSLHGRLPTMRTNAGLLWSPWARRFLTHRERFAVMGYPVYLELAAAMGVTAPAWCLPDTVAMRQVLGNAMHVACVTMMLLVGLSCVKPAS